MDDPVLAYEEGRPVRRSEVTARMWAAQEGMVAVARKLADDIGELADWPDNADVRYAAGRLEHAYERQDLEAWWAALADFLQKLAELKEASVL
jgi:hypothetical protein